MKKLLLLSLMTITGLGNMQAQEQTKESSKKNIVKTELSSLIAVRYDFNLKWEHQLSKRTSFQLGFLLRDKIVGQRRFGLEFTAAYRFYFSKTKELKGWYVSPYLQYTFGQYPLKTNFSCHDCPSGYYHNQYPYSNDNSYNYSMHYKNFSAFDGGLLIGHQWLLKNNFVIDINAGINASSYLYQSRFSDFAYPTMNINFGYKF